MTMRDLDEGEARAPGELRCPYCGEAAEVEVDPGGGEEQTFIQDCAVCCRPWTVHVRLDEEGCEAVELGREDD